MRVLLDLDGVLAAWGDLYDSRLDEWGRVAADIPRTAQQSDWNLKAGRTEMERLLIDEVMTDETFYDHLELIPGAREAVETLAISHDVWIVSSPYLPNPTCASQKYTWVEDHLGVGWAERTILTLDKTMVDGDVLIDDRPGVYGAQDPSWRHILFGDYAYNRHLPGERITDWDSAFRTHPLFVDARNDATTKIGAF